MAKVKIINDGGGVYEHDEIIEVEDLIRDYCDCDNDEETQAWLKKVSVITAVKHISDMWELDVEFV